MTELALHMIHSQSQLNDISNQEKLARAKVVIVGAGWPDYSSVKAKAPDAKLLVSFNLHMIRRDTSESNPLLKAFREKLYPFILKDEIGNLFNNIDYSNNWEYHFSKELAKIHAKAIWEMIKVNPQIDGVYIDDCWGNPPPRYMNAYSLHYGENPNWYIEDFQIYRESFLRSLNYWIPNDKIIICNTAGALAKGTSGVTIESHIPRDEAISVFNSQKGFWNVAWFYDPAIEIENAYMRVLKGVSLNN